MKTIVMVTLVKYSDAEVATTFRIVVEHSDAANGGWLAHEVLGTDAAGDPAWRPASTCASQRELEAAVACMVRGLATADNGYVENGDRVTIDLGRWRLKDGTATREAT